MSDIITAAADHTPCINCEAHILPGTRFCNHCGALQLERDPVSVNDKWTALKQVALFYSIQLTLCGLLTFVDALKTFGWFVIGDVCLAGTAVLFFCYNWAETRQVLKWPGFSVWKLLLYCVAAMAGSLCVSFVVNWLNHTLFSKDISYYNFFILTTSHPKLWMVFSVAITPAIFEELAYRGFVLQNMLKIVDTKQAVIIISFLFAVIHLSFISLFWLVPFALLLGWVRVKENTMWYGVCIHFCFNFTVCILEIFGK